MSFSSFVGWRYLRHRRGRAALVAVFVSLALALLGAALFVRATWPGQHLPWAFKIGAVTLLLASALATIVAILVRAFSVFTAVSIVGVMLGVAALVVVLGVTSGFQQEFQDKVLGVNAHVIVMRGGSEFPTWRDVQKQLSQMPEVEAAAPFVFADMQAANGVLQSSDLLVKGIDPATSGRVLDLPKQLEPGSEKALEELARREDTQGEPGVIFGTTLAKKLKVKVGDVVQLLSPLGSGAAAAGAKIPAPRTYRVVGVFFAGFEEYDKKLVYVHLKESQRLRDIGDNVNGVETRLHDPDIAVKLARRLEKQLGPGYRIIDWQELNHNLFTALKMQRVVIFLVMTLIVVVAAFNVVASLSLVVTSKRREVAMMKSMGARGSAVARVFLVAGVTIGALGVLAGTALGLLICWAASRFGYPLDPKIYLISSLPVRIVPVELVITAAVAILLALVATLYPSWRASRLQPAEGLRQE